MTAPEAFAAVPTRLPVDGVWGSGDDPEGLAVDNLATRERIATVAAAAVDDAVAAVAAAPPPQGASAQRFTAAMTVPTCSSVSVG